MLFIIIEILDGIFLYRWNILLVNIMFELSLAQIHGTKYILVGIIIHHCVHFCMDSLVT